jgi:HAD superfamily hydrolase (TIGR01509 family)
VTTAAESDDLALSDAVDLWLFDLDGVLTDSAKAHAAAWKAMFDEYLAALRPPAEPFDLRDDYLSYVDGRPRQDGIRTFLASRHLTVPEQSPPDDPSAPSVQRMGDRKTQLFLAAVRAGAVSIYPDALALLDSLRARGDTLAVVSSSANARTVLEHTGLLDRFALVMDGVLAARDGLAGKPSPDTFLAATKMLNGEPSRAAVLDDATVGVQAGRTGGFHLVIGVDRTGNVEALRAAGADRVLSDLRRVVDE